MNRSAPAQALVIAASLGMLLGPQAAGVPRQTVSPDEAARIAQQRTREAFAGELDQHLCAGTPTTYDPVPAFYLPAQLGQPALDRVQFLWPETRPACEVVTARLAELLAADLETRRALIPPFWDRARESIAVPALDARGAMAASSQLRQAWHSLTARLAEAERAGLQAVVDGELPATEQGRFLDRLAEWQRACPRRVADAVTPGANARPFDFIERWSGECIANETAQARVRESLAAHVVVVASLYDQWDSAKAKVAQAEGAMQVALQESATEPDPASAAEQRQAALAMREPALRALASAERAIVGETRAVVQLVADVVGPVEGRSLLRAYGVESFGMIAVDPYDAAELLRQLVQDGVVESPPSWTEQAVVSADYTVSEATRAFEGFWTRYVQRYLTNAREEADLCAAIERSYARARGRTTELLALVRATAPDAGGTSDWRDECLQRGDQRASATLAALRQQLPPVRQPSAIRDP